MVKLGNFLFHYRNFLFPVFYLALFIPGPPILQNHLLAFEIGFSILILGQLVRLLTIGLSYVIRGGKDRKVYAEGLVTDGIYAHCRNPMYLGNVVIILGLGILANSLIFVLLMVPLFFFFYQAIILAEEGFLINKFAGQFLEYKDKVNSWIPNLNGISETIKGMTFKWKRVVLKEYNTTFLLVLTVAILLIKAIYLQNGPGHLEYLGWLFIFIITPPTIVYTILRISKKKNWLVAD